MQLRDFILLNINGQRIFSKELKNLNIFKELDKIFDHYRYGSFKYRTMELESILFDINSNFKLKFKSLQIPYSLMGSHELVIHDYDITNKTTLLELRKELVRCLVRSRILTKYESLPYLSKEDIDGLRMLEELVS